MSSPAPALKALLEQYLDYAGFYPPAALTVDNSAKNYSVYGQSEHKWMLRNLVLNAADADAALGASGKTGVAGTKLRLSLLGDADHKDAVALETKDIVKADGKPVYCEVKPGDVHMLDAVKRAGCFAKIRTGAVKPDGIPQPIDVATFIIDCAEMKLPFKATAGLHHPVRALYPLTYADDAPRAVMHGFLNVLMASAFAWHGDRDIVEILSETQPKAFTFDDRAYWRERSLSIDEIKDARAHFIHSVGSCSFEEPVEDLKNLGLL